MMAERIIIVAGPRRGKSTLAEELSIAKVLGERHSKIRCGDPLSKVKDPMPGVEYLPEGLPFSGDDGAAQWVADNWFTLPGPWICEGHVMARALRRWLGTHPVVSARPGYPRFPCDRIIVLDRHGFNNPSPRQDGMHAGVMKVWREIAHEFEPITEYRDA